MKPTSGKNWKKYIFQYIEENKTTMCSDRAFSMTAADFWKGCATGNG